MAENQRARLAPIPGVDGRRSKFEPTFRQREIVAMLIANRVPLKIIALTLDIGDRTLDRHFEREIKYGRDHMIARVGMTVLRKALKGNMNAARYWLMTHGGPEWRLGKQDLDTEAVAFASASADKAGKVRFYLPQNGRDRPEGPETVTIDADADEVGVA
jgi:hypothetical protein